MSALLTPPGTKGQSNPGAAATRQPLVSIIVPTLNRAHFLERCLRSVLGQTYSRIECLVMDGGSTDHSVDILRRLAQADPRLKFISQPDRGEVDATNRGMDLVTGEIMGVQASDDFYVPDALEQAVDFLLVNPECVGVSGDALYVDDQGVELTRGVVTYRGKMTQNRIKRILRSRYKSCFVCHGSFFGWRARLLAHGKLDPLFSVTPDWDYYLRLLAAGERIGCLPRIQYKYTVHAGMGARKHFDRVEAQRAQLHRRYGMKWHDELFRSTIGRALSYFANPYRSPFAAGLKREIQDALARRFGR
jgi:glycosyltransferase involved in cell wall biosynthesis